MSALTEPLSWRDAVLMVIGAALIGILHVGLRKFAYPSLGITNPPTWGITGAVPYYLAFIAVAWAFGVLGMFKRHRVLAGVCAVVVAIALTLFFFWLFR